MKKLKFGDIISPKSQRLKPDCKRDFFFVLNVGSQHNNWTIVAIHSNNQFECNSQLMPEDINDFETVKLYKSYLLNRKICLYEYFYEQAVEDIVTDFYGTDGEIQFKSDRLNFIANAFYSFELKDKKLEGYLIIKTKDD